MSDKTGEPGLSRRMVTRIWKGRVRNAVAEEYAAYLYRNGVRHLMSVGGNLGVQMFRRPDREATEFMVVSYWDPATAEDAIRSFAGANAAQAWLLTKDKEYLLDPGRPAEHYDLLFETRAAN
jgi:heme-degrading monooxygenase HmoA